MTSATITHVHVADPAGVEYASESASKHEATVALREPVVYRQRGSSEFTLLAGIRLLEIPYTNVRKIETWYADASEV